MTSRSLGHPLTQYCRTLFPAVLIILAAGPLLGAGYQSGGPAASWSLGINLSDSGNPCEAQFNAQVGIVNNAPVHYASKADAVADATAAFPQVFLHHIVPANPAAGLSAAYVYGIPNCPYQSVFGPVIFSFSVFYDPVGVPVGSNGLPCPALVPPPITPIPEGMEAHFTAPGTYTLASYAAACGFIAFDWQQKITHLPGGSAVTPSVPSKVPNNVYPASCAQASAANFNAPYNCTLVAGSSTYAGNPVFPPLFDPPDGGLTYMVPNTNPYPFYYPLANLKGNATGGCTVQNTANCPGKFHPIITADDKTLYFFDTPALGSAVSGETPSATPQGSYVAFTTTLMGVSMGQSPGSQSCGPGNPYNCTPLFAWNWNSTFNGVACTQSPTSSGFCGTGGVSQTATFFELIPGSGSGGVTLTGINGGPLPPTFSLAAGTYNSAQTLSMADATPGTTIYYTTDGTNPNTTSPTYSAPVTIATTETIQAIAVASDSSQSLVTSATYNIVLPPAAPPSLNPGGGAYTSAQTVTISDTTPGASIYYTTNGSAPTAASTLYAAPIHVASTQVIKAIAVAPGFSPSPVATAGYTVTFPASPTQTVLTISPTTAPLGSVFTLQAAVTASGAPVPAGSVTFSVGAISLATVPVNAATGVAALRTAALIPGLNNISAKFNANTLDLASTSNVVGVTVANKFATTATLTSSGVQSAYVLTAGLTAFGAGTPGGAVAFTDLSTQTLLGTAAPASPATVFAGTGTLPAAHGAQDIATADLNGDGFQDIVVVAYSASANWVGVSLGKGDGTFGALQPVITLAGDNNGGSSVAVADVNGDGKPDILATSWAGYGLAVFAGNGDGTFGPETHYPVDSGYANSVAAGDFNGDGKLDAVTADPFGNSMSILLGNGDGTFQTALPFATDTSPEAVTVADLNNDGHLDVAVLNTTGTASVFLGRGDGTFQPASLVPVSANGHFEGPRAIAAADFNGDGKTDLAVSIWDSQSVGILYGNGDGTFQPVQLTATPNASPTGVAVADIDRDGQPDLVESSYNGSIATVLMNRGGGALSVSAYSVDNGAGSVALGDFNGDGLMDFATISSVNSTVSVRLARSVLTASLSGVTLPGLGVDNVSATYSGDATFSGATSNTLALASNVSAAATPAFSPGGGTYSSSQVVTISDATPGAAIYYTTSGASPTAASTRYTSPVSVSVTGTLKAIAIASGYAASSVASAVYTITGSTPTLTQVSPAAGLQGSTVAVTLTGTNLAANATLAIAGAGVTPANIVVVSGTSITASLAIAANATTGIHNLTVTTPGGTTNALAFTVNPAASSAPSISAISPPSGIRGQVVPVVISGANFIPGATVGVHGAGVTQSSFVVVSSTRMTANITIGANAAIGTDTVTVTTSAGVSSPFPFTVLAAAAPSISNIAPSSAIQGQTVTVTITGSNFTAGATSVNVSGTGVTAGNIVVASSTSLTAVLTVASNAAAGAYSVTVSTGSGGSGAVTFTVVQALPVITGITPPAGRQGQTVPVSISGANFSAGATVSVGGAGVAAGSVVVVSGTSIAVSLTIAPNAAVGAYSLTVTTAAGTSIPSAFSVMQALPVISGVTPLSGTQGQTVPVTITGSGFTAGSSVAVSGAGVTAGSVVIVSGASINASLAIAANAPTGVHNITVTTPAGSSNSVSFTVNAAVAGAPTVTGISPSVGMRGQTVQVTITGTNFSPGATVAVRGAGVSQSSFVVTGSTQMTAVLTIAPTAVAGADTVTVKTAAGTSNGVTFTVQ